MVARQYQTKHMWFAVACWFAAALTGCACESLLGDKTPVSDNADAGDTQEVPPTQDILREVEPNNRAQAASAFVLRPVDPGSSLLQPLEGQLSSAQDIDWVRLPVHEGLALRTLRLVPQCATCDLALRWKLADSPTADPATNDTDLAPPGQPEVISNLDAARDVLVAVVPGKANKGPFPLHYKVELSRGALAGSIEIEPGDPKGQVVEIPGERQGLVNYRNDIDTFLLRPADGKVEAHDALRLELRAPKDLQLGITVLDKEGEVLVQERLEKNEDQESGPWLWMRPNLRASAIDSLVLRSLGKEPGATGAYTLRALWHPPLGEGESLEVEPNSATSPQQVSKSSRIVGYLNTPQDRDFFVVQIPPAKPDAPPMIFGVRLDGEELNWAVEVREANKKRTLNNAKSGETEFLCNKVVSSGEVVLEVFEHTPRKKKPAERSTNTPGRYALTVALRTAEREEIEPNGRTAKATVLPDEQPHRGFIYPAKDVDLWKFTVPAPEKLPEDGTDPFLPWEVLLRGTKLNLRIEVLDEDGVRVAQVDKGGAGEGEKLRLDLPPGVYFARVKGSGVRGSCDKAYTISAQPRSTP